MKKFKRKLKKIINDKQLLTIFIMFIAVIIAGIFILGIKKTAIIVIVLVLIGSIIKAIINKKNGKKPSKKEKEKRKNIIIDIFLFGILICIILGIAFVIYIAVSAPTFNPNNLYSKESSIVYSDDGTVIAKLGSEIRQTITYDQMPEVLVDAIIATEDSRFFQHNGLDLPRFTKAVIGQLLGNSSAGGGSTITMQVSKNAYTSSVSSGIQGIIRKFTDIYMSVFKIEKKYTKEQILEYYVNIPFLGSNSYGVAEASQTYFGKDVSELNLSEAALLAGLFQAPSSYDPYLHPEAAASRRSTVLNLMRRHGYITKEEEEIANSISVESLLSTKSYTNPYQSYIDLVLSEIEEKTGENPYNTPMKIYTSMDVEKQDHLNKTVDEFAFPNDKTQEGIAVTDVETGAILAISGGRNITAAYSWNRATDTKIQPGSTAKPIFDYGPGVEYLNWSTYTPFIDEPWSYTDGPGIKNWDGGFKGFLTLKEALGLSRNIPALKAFQNVAANLGNSKIKSYVTSVGITPEIEGGYVHEAHALGAFTGTNPLSMAAAYAVFANGGYYIKPYTVNKIVYLDTNETKEFKTTKTKVMEDSSAYIITKSLIWSVDSGLATGVRIYGREVAAKTGTTNLSAETIESYNLPVSAIKDYWVVGYTPKISIGLWYGYDKLTDGYNTQADNSRKDKLFKAVMSGMVDDSPKTFTQPSSVTAVSVERGTIPAMLPSDYTPSNLISTEYFKSGTEPTEVSPRYVPLDNVNNLTSAVENNNVTLTWNAVNMPEYYTESYMNTHITDGMGDFKDNYIEYRKSEVEALGTISYDIYLTDSTTDIFLTNTTDTSYTMDISRYSSNVTFTVKTCWSNDKTTISSGATTTVSTSSQSNQSDNNKDVSVINVNLKGDQVINLDINDTFIDQGVVVFENLVNDVTKNATIVTTITDKNNNKVNSVDTSKENTYTITYTVTYNSKTYTAVRTVDIKQNESN